MRELLYYPIEPEPPSYYSLNKLVDKCPIPVIQMSVLPENVIKVIV
jgi:hypothetical protein